MEKDAQASILSRAGFGGMARRRKEFLIIKPTGCTNFSNLFLE